MSSFKKNSKNHRLKRKKEELLPKKVKVNKCKQKKIWKQNKKHASPLVTTKINPSSETRFYSPFSLLLFVHQVLVWCQQIVLNIDPIFARSAPTETDFAKNGWGLTISWCVHPESHQLPMGGAIHKERWKKIFIN